MGLSPILIQLIRKILRSYDLRYLFDFTVKDRVIHRSERF